MTVTAIIGGGYGSEGKGVIAAKMAKQYQMAVRTGGPNAGHSFYHGDEKQVMRSVPCAWINPGCDLVIGPGAVVKRDLLIEEATRVGRRVWLDRAAALIDHAAEAEEQGGLVDRVGSTAEGVGVTRIRRINRDPSKVTLAGQEAWPANVSITDTAAMVYDRLHDGARVMLEGTQGSGLSLYHGPWPYTTSADCNVAGFLSEAGIAPAWLAHTILVVRTFPIRVGGNSGPMVGELQWGDIAGAPTPETTTVTKRQRRIGEFDHAEFAKAIILNNPCAIVTTFLDYLDPAIAGTTRASDLAMSTPVRNFVNMVEATYGVPVIAGGTGGARWSVARLEQCAHGDFLL